MPLLVRGPDIPGARQIAGPAQLEDLHPTLLAMLGLPVDDTADGLDLLPWLRGEHAISPRRASLGQRRFEEDAPPSFYVRTPSSKWIGDPERGGETFDLAADPREFTVRSESAAPTALTQRLAEHAETLAKAAAEAEASKAEAPKPESAIAKPAPAPKPKGADAPTPAPETVATGDESPKPPGEEASPVANEEPRDAPEAIEPVTEPALTTVASGRTAASGPSRFRSPLVCGASEPSPTPCRPTRPRRPRRSRPPGRWHRPRARRRPYRRPVRKAKLGHGHDLPRCPES